MRQPRIITGTWEEISSRAREFAGTGQVLELVLPSDTAAGEIRALESNGPSQEETSDAGARDPELVARVRSIRGMFAHNGGEPLTEVLHRERQKDKAREEELYRGHQP